VSSHRVRVGVHHHPPSITNLICGHQTTYSSPHDKVPSKVLPVLLGGGRVEGLSVVLGHGGVFGQGFEEGDGGVEEPFVCRVGVFGDYGGEFVDVVVVEVGAGCGGGVEVWGPWLRLVGWCSCLVLS
jgi:hypothetical protein